MRVCGPEVILLNCVFRAVGPVMSDIIVQLREEHETMSRILDLMERELALFDGGEVADYHLLQEIMDYCLDYPEACHHPKEDAVYAIMMERQPNLHAGIADLGAAHEKLSAQTRHVHETVERLMRDETVSRDLVTHVIGGFIESYRLHIRLEEDNLFPEALRLLDGDDWSRVAVNLVRRANPLNDSNERRFATLRDGILRDEAST